MSEIQIVNMIAKGQLDTELDLKALCEDIIVYESYIKGPGLYLKFEEDGPILTIARSGKYFSSGVKSFEELDSIHKDFSDLMNDLGVVPNNSEVSFEVVNVVTLQDLDIQSELSRLAMSLGMENIEYEPEQFAGLVYKPKISEGTVLIFSSGKVIVTGSKEISDSKKIHKSVESFLQSNI